MKTSSADRVVFPDDGITKGDVVAFYEHVADSMFQFLEGRALTVERYPKGLSEAGFMQKNAPSHLDDQLIGRHEVGKEDGGTTTYPVVRDKTAIPVFANLGVISFHVPTAKVSDERHPDWLIWDMDPPPGEFALVREASIALRVVLQSFGLETHLMTSGSNGYHLRMHLDRSLEVELTTRLARGVAALAGAAHPDLMTVAFRKKERGGRVFVDWLRNAPYATAVAPWSIRARPGAPVACPIRWDELVEIDPNGVDMETAEERLDLSTWADDGPQSIEGVVDDVDSALEDAGIELEPFDRFRSR